MNVIDKICISCKEKIKQNKYYFNSYVNNEYISYDITYGRKPCPICKRGCYDWLIDNEPNFYRDKIGRCCFCLNDINEY